MCVCVWHCMCVWQHVVECVCGCVWSVCQQLCCPLAPFASDSFIHCTARRPLSPVSLSNLPPSRPAWTVCQGCRSAQTALAWPCITVAANQFESSGAHVKKAPKSALQILFSLRKLRLLLPLTAAPSVKRVKITTNLFGYAANCYSTPSIRSSSTSSSTSSSFCSFSSSKIVDCNKTNCILRRLLSLSPNFFALTPIARRRPVRVCF